MRHLTRLLKILLWIVALVYFAIVTLTHLPVVQKRLAEELSAIVGKELGTYCSIGSVKLGFLSRMEINDVLLRDRQKVDMLRAKTVAAAPDFFDIIKGRITINAAQIFGADVVLYKEAESGELNCQFVIDKLNDKDSKEPSKLNLRINTLILRNSSLAYEGTRLSGLNANLVLYQLMDGDVDLAIKKLAFKVSGRHEVHPYKAGIADLYNGLELKRLDCDFTKTGDELKLRNIDLQLADGRLLSDSIIYNLSTKNYRGDINADYRDLSLRARVAGNMNQIALDGVSLGNTTQTIRFHGQADIGFEPDSYHWRADIADSYIDLKDLRHTFFEIAKIDLPTLPQQLADLGYIAFTGRTEGGYNAKAAGGLANALSGFVNGDISSALGDISLNFDKSLEQIQLTAKTQNLDLGKLIQDSRFGVLSADVEATAPVSSIAGIFQATKPFGTEFLSSVLSLKANIRQLIVPRPRAAGTAPAVQVAGHSSLTLKDILADLNLKNGNLSGTLNVSPQNIASFDANIDLDISQLMQKKLIGHLILNKIHYDKYSLAQLRADFDEDGADIQTDMAKIAVSGDIDARRLDSNIHISDMEKLDKLLALGLNAQGAVDAEVRLRGDSISGNLVSSLLTVASVNLHNVAADFDILDKRIDSRIKLDNGSRNNNLRLALNSTVNLAKDINVHIRPSQLYVRDTLFTISESDIAYRENSLTINNLTVEHGAQHIIINSQQAENFGKPLEKDSIFIDINEIDVPYVLNFVNFHSVDFTGKASGYAVVSNLFSKPEAEAALTVEDFTFEDGRMGTLLAKAAWNNSLGQIDIDALCDDEGRYTKIDGYISPTKNELDLQILADRTRGEFIAGYTKSFLSDVDLSISGRCRVFGRLGGRELSTSGYGPINLTGVATATGRFHVKSLGTDYTIQNQPIICEVNEINFAGDTIRDQYGEYGVVTGQLHHKALARLTYDIRVEPHNMLCYDFPTYGREIFFGKAFATGICDIIGRPGQITFNINANVEKGSFIEYNASNPDAITGQQFITWRNLTLHQLPDASNTVYSDFTSDIRMNVTAHVGEGSTLRVLMDGKSGDLIALHGNGDLRATYYNKGKFELYGNYLVESGTYDMTIQNLIKKRFLFQPGSQIVFGGEPYDAQLSLKAKYPVNSVPLSDLQIGNSFKNNNVHVDCLMDITGTPDQPLVDFDFDLPTVNADAKSMIHSLINTEQEKNQQVIYLLAIGRFYTQETATGGDAERQSQASLAMQSFLSGTISQQINNALGTVTRSQNWNIGANISPGDDGLYNAEYEGLLSGSLFNNRLLINGQFGYRDNPNATSSFIGDFDVRYLLVPNGNIAVRVYNQTNDRYFTRSSLNTQGLGLIFKHDFQRFLARRRKMFHKIEKQQMR